MSGDNIHKFLHTDECFTFDPTFGISTHKLKLSQYNLQEEPKFASCTAESYNKASEKQFPRQTKESYHSIRYEFVDTKED